MKIRINILPDAQKEERFTEQKIGAVLRFGLLICFVLAFFSSVLLVAQIILYADYKVAKAGSESRRQNVDKESDQAEQFLADINSLSQKINKTSDETPRWSKVFLRISQIAASDIKLTSVHVEKEHMKISGFSKTREAFLEFQEKLKGEGLKNLKSPVSNVVSPKDFDFEVKADIDKNYLNQP
ncbi:MAG: hypothetical protein QMD77_02695 [Patescibacteria group bacterium]|nr:hypothetical protein [Patescibacteria group bacterium]